MGARVEGDYGGEGEWYPGTISRVNDDGTYDVAYDDGDHEEAVPRDRVRRFDEPEPPAAPEDDAYADEGFEDGE